jgi:hypothetical protein
MRIARRLVSLCLLSAAVPIAHAQEAPKPPAPEAPRQQQAPQEGAIVVTGQTQTPVKRAQHYIRQVLETRDGQLARFIDPVCPLVIGLPDRFKNPIEDRIRLVAGAASVRLAKDKCQPNLVIVFAENSDTLIETMRKHRNAAFTNLDDGALRDAFQDGPIHAWRLVATRDEVGNYSTGNDDPDYPPVMEGDTQAVTINAVVVMDRKVAMGKSVRQLGDYVVMRTLVGAKPPAKGSIASASILSLFDPAVAPPPTEITDMDIGLLAGLYRMKNPYESGTDQAWRISRAMAPGTRR